MDFRHFSASVYLPKLAFRNIWFWVVMWCTRRYSLKWICKISNLDCGREETLHLLALLSAGDFLGAWLQGPVQPRSPGRWLGSCILGPRSEPPCFLSAIRFKLDFQECYLRKKGHSGWPINFSLSPSVLEILILRSKTEDFSGHFYKLAIPESFPIPS